MNFYLVVGKGNNTNNFPYAYSRIKNKAYNYAELLKNERQSIRVQRCTDIFWVSERAGLFGKTLWKIRIDENINTIPFEKILEQIPSSAQ